MVFVAGEVSEQGMECRLPEEPVVGGRGFSLEDRVVDGARATCMSWGVDIASQFSGGW
jgi:hypothetical protein